MGIAKNIVVPLIAAKQARPSVNANGLKNRRTKIISKALSTPDVFRRGESSIRDTALQDRLKAQRAELNKKSPDFKNIALQDFLSVQPAVIIGLISNLIGSPLQDDIAKTLSRMQQSGQDILYQTRNEKGENHDYQNTRFT